MSNSPDKKALELLFDRPLEPVFTPRDDGKAIFELPRRFYSEEYAGAKDEIQSRYGGEFDFKIPLRLPEQIPDLSFAKRLGKRKQFSLFNSEHQSIATDLIKIFMSAPNGREFVNTCAYCKDRVNLVLFQYCYSVAVQHRKDTANFPVKPITELFPQNFVDPAVFKEARAQGVIFRDQGNRYFIDVPRNYTASNREEEQRLGYFREDVGVNSQHWDWHLLYPGNGPMEVVKKDRRGELFYYMHHQILARYNVERFCNGLAKVKVLNNIREPITEGYFPKILSAVNNRTYPSRLANTKLSDLNRDDTKLEIADMERWADRIVTAIDQGFVVDSEGNQIPLDPKKGIDILGDIVESTSLSVNRKYYGSLHNEGHTAISYCHDPESRFLEDFGVMGDVTTAMRDPIFYRWHAYIDTIFNRHKELLNPYSKQELEYNGIIVSKLEVKMQSQAGTPNTLLTRVEKSNLDLAAGLEYGPKGNIYATFTHLQHAPFDYVIDVTNSNNTPMKGTCRIFLCPKSDERATPLPINDQRQLAIEMDKFTVNLMPGPNNIYQASNKSSITIPHERTFRPVGEDDHPKDAEKQAEFGWPEHMLLPRGKLEGMTFDLFVMISDYKDDAVVQTNNNPDVCGESSSFCGLKDKLYPDNRSMGYPFDRRMEEKTLQELVNGYSNMSMTDIVIIFKDQNDDKNN